MTKLSLKLYIRVFLGYILNTTMLWSYCSSHAYFSRYHSFLEHLPNYVQSSLSADVISISMLIVDLFSLQHFISHYFFSRRILTNWFLNCYFFSPLPALFSIDFLVVQAPPHEDHMRTQQVSPHRMIRPPLCIENSSSKIICRFYWLYLHFFVLSYINFLQLFLISGNHKCIVYRFHYWMAGCDDYGTCCPSSC